MILRFRQRNGASGFMLLEALIAILIFSIGILALVGMQATATRESGDAKYRSEAALLANELIGNMWTSDRTTATLQANFNTGGAQYLAWLNNSVTAALPGVAANPPNVVIDATGIATIQIFWVVPGEQNRFGGPLKHKYTIVAQIQ
jgi:type IV pilus assembly protein PilV